MLTVCVWLCLLCDYLRFLLASGPKNTESKYPLDNVLITSEIKYQIILQIIFFLVMRSLLVAVGDFIIVYSACIWYYQKDSQPKQNNIW